MIQNSKNTCYMAPEFGAVLTGALNVRYREKICSKTERSCCEEDYYQKEVTNYNLIVKQVEKIITLKKNLFMDFSNF